MNSLVNPLFQKSHPHSQTQPEIDRSFKQNQKKSKKRRTKRRFPDGLSKNPLSVGRECGLAAHYLEFL